MQLFRSLSSYLTEAAGKAKSDDDGLVDRIGSANEPGKPGPVIGIAVERGVHQALPNSADSSPSSSPHPPTVPPAHHQPLPSPVNFHAIVLATPRWLERYDKGGNRIGRVPMQPAMAAFETTRIAGVGSCHLCGCLDGRVVVLKAGSLEVALVLELPDNERHTDAADGDADHGDSLPTTGMAAGALDLSITAVGVYTGLDGFAQRVLAGNQRGQVIIWEVPSERVLHTISSPRLVTSHGTSLSAASTAARSSDAPPTAPSDEGQQPSDGRRPSQEDGSQGGWRRASSLVSEGRDFIGCMAVVRALRQLWVGYGSGMVAVYQLKDFRLDTTISFAAEAKGGGGEAIDSEGGASPATEMESGLPVNALCWCAPLGLLLALVGSRSVFVLSAETMSIVQRYSAGLMTCGSLLSSIKVVDEPLGGSHAAPASILLLAGVDGSLVMRRLLRRGSDGKIQCVLIRQLGAELPSESDIPITCLHVDSPLDALFCGDASAVCSIVRPFRVHLLSAGAITTARVEDHAPPYSLYPGGPAATTDPVNIGRREQPSTTGAADVVLPSLPPVRVGVAGAGPVQSYVPPAYTPHTQREGEGDGQG
ncbi:unnamed protein product [Vitrella brassicaformis CCMP3155]|uniref:Uncharacterized protein n=3 Tax=Vitrella brassicaformis TaxID=1169539 RepID=A0A0G4GBH6_VITBC|nr:unnamed protein product [Vitrella brassicaformis CCMP3155]|eukprot:CEM26331.1 unnamed protein product [Vitrella brassicaformis CCMP3155]